MFYAGFVDSGRGKMPHVSVFHESRYGRWRRHLVPLHAPDRECMVPGTGKESSRETLVASGSDLGTISALIISPAIMAASGWQRIFVVFSAFSFFWVVMYVHEGAGQPGDDPRITVEERTSILRNRIANPGTTHQTLRRAGRSSNWTFAELSIHTLHTLNWRVLVTSGPRRRSMLRTCATITVGSSCWTGSRSMLAKA